MRNADESAYFEEWEPAPAPFERTHEVSNYGSVRGLFYGGRKLRTPKIKKLQLDPGGYLRVMLWSGDFVKNWLINRLVLTVFDSPMPSSIHARHLDGNKLNNYIHNLKWGSRKENEADKKAHGRSPIGTNNGLSKLNDAEVLKIREAHNSGLTMQEIAVKFGCCQQNISAIITRKTWKHI